MSEKFTFTQPTKEIINAVACDKGTWEVRQTRISAVTLPVLRVKIGIQE